MLAESAIGSYSLINTILTVKLWMRELVKMIKGRDNDAREGSKGVNLV